MSVLLVIGFLEVFLLGDRIAVGVDSVITTGGGLMFGVFKFYVIGCFDRKMLPYFLSIVIMCKRVRIKRLLPWRRVSHNLVITFIPTTIIHITIKVPFSFLYLVSFILSI